MLLYVSVVCIYCSGGGYLASGPCCLLFMLLISCVCELVCFMFVFVAGGSPASGPFFVCLLFVCIYVMCCAFLACSLIVQQEVLGLQVPAEQMLMLVNQYTIIWVFAGLGLVGLGSWMSIQDHPMNRNMFNTPIVNENG